MENKVFAGRSLREMRFNPDFWDSLSPWQQQGICFALIKYGGGIVQMSGSIAGDTHARNRFGNYMRARTKPVNPKSPRQVAARIAMMFLAEQWRESPMTDAYRTAWQTYANSVNWNNKLGEVVTLTGFNMFIRSNAVNIICDKALNYNGPTDLGLPAGDPAFSIAISAATGMTVTFDDQMDWCSEDGAYLVIEHGLPQNPTRNFFAGPWRFNGALGGSSVAPPTSPQGPWVSNCWPEIEGQKWWCRASILRSDGRVSTKFEASPVIVAA